MKRAVGVELDDSEESLAYVDHYITTTARAEAADSRLGAEVLALVAPALGAYLGQVAIARFGGKWLIDGADPAAWRVELSPAPLTFHPVGMAAEALRGEEVDGYDAAFTTREDLTGPLLEALESTPPVDEAYYYSLTGRLETLAHALDILIEIERRKRDKLN
ncbi:MAG: hypothetical protein LC659_01055 [Myxococcales bacterium]|nr:hypothetical protein [Myxococcales bacterium]